MPDVPCATAARDRHESLHATASIVRNWVLVEQPGPWGRDAPAESRLRKDVAHQLQARAELFDFRLVLLRRVRPERPDRAGGVRPERPDRAGGMAPDEGSARRAFVVRSQRPSRGIEELIVDDPADLLRLDLSPLGDGRPTGAGRRRDHPLFLVCTNGKHDPCCARLGRPIVRALGPAVGEAVWECSHIGGDRFAGNLVCLPHGFYFGGLGPEEAARVVESYRRGTIELDWFRGTAGDPYVVQAAEFFVRRDHGLLGVDDVSPTGWRKLRTGVIEVELLTPGAVTLRATVAVTRSAEARPLTCTAPSPEQPLAFSLLDLRSVEAPDAGH